MKTESTGILALYQSKNTVFTAKEVALLWRETNSDRLKRRLNYYVKSGKLYHLRRGVYAKSVDYDRYELSNKIYTPSYVSLETVLKNEGVIFQHYASVSAVSYLTREITADAAVYVYWKIEKNILVNRSGVTCERNFFIATKERAFLDTLYLNKEYHFDNLTPLDWEVCFELAPIYESRTLPLRVEKYFKESKNAGN